MPFLCSAYKHSSPRQEPITCQGSCNRHKSNDAIARTSAYGNGQEKSFNVNSCQTFKQPIDSGNSNSNNGRYDNCQTNIARFSLGFDVRTAAAGGAADQRAASSSVVVRRVFCTNITGSSETRENTRFCDLSYANYAKALLCYVALNVVAAVFLGNKPIMPAFFASQFCGAMTIIYWSITGTLPI